MEYIKVSLKNILNITRIVTLYYLDLSPNYQTLGEKHDFWEIVYVDSGELNLQGGKKCYHAKQGDIIFHRPNEYHNIQCDGTHAASIFIISFECNSPCMRFFHEKHMGIPHELDSLLRNLMTECTCSFQLSSFPLQYNESPPIGSMQLVRNYLECFLIRLIRSEEKKKNQSIFFTSQDNLNDKLATDIKDFLRKNLYNRITLQNLSEHFHFGVSTLCTAFRKNTGESIIHYFLQMKIKEAKKLLSEKNLTITEISNLLGFDNPLYFSRAFHKYTGSSPSNFRKKLKNSSTMYN